MSLIDIDDYKGLYKFNKDLNQVYNVKTNKYLKNCLDKGILCVYLYKDGKRKQIRLNSLIYRYNNQDNPDNFVDIDNYENYKFDKKRNQVINTNTGKYIKNCLNGKNYSVKLLKDGDKKRLMLNHLIYKYNNQDVKDDFVDIDNYENYKFNLKTNEVKNKNTGKILKNTLNNTGYYSVNLYKNGKKKSFLLHRLTYQAHNPLINIEGSDIDHINHNKLDNNINNLRIATRSQNICNVKVKNNKSTGIKNIYKNELNNFKVQIMKDGKKHSKTFKTLEEAIEHRDLKLTELHGEFACF